MVQNTREMETMSVKLLMYPQNGREAAAYYKTRYYTERYPRIKSLHFTNSKGNQHCHMNDRSVLMISKNLFLNTSIKKKNGHVEWPYLPGEMGDVSHLHEASNIKCYVIAESSWKDKKAILIEIVPRSIDPFLSNGFPVQINSSARQSSGIYRDKSYF